MRGFVVQARQLFCSGYSLDRLSALQAAVSQVRATRRPLAALLPMRFTRKSWGIRAQGLGSSHERGVLATEAITFPRARGRERKKGQNFIAYILK